ncbi:MAG: hypothetical protein KZQ89_02965 [Candidatus Thiodiazotropha sp. (ex Lucinoma kastoroae)]|nr:hypothetical protein [Candidatus Thiodiazotropha sp. (ex Lucinoma kastoroae)]
MISKKFTTLAVGATLALSSAFATPAMAGADCTAADKANITQSKDSGVRIVDFTKSSTACLEYFADKLSRTKLLLVADGDYRAWRDINVDVAKRLRSEGIPTNVFFTGATDGDNTTAMTVAWGNGVERGVASVSIGGGHTINEIAAAPDKAASYVHEKGTKVWNEFLKRPEHTASLALNQ